MTVVETGFGSEDPDLAPQGQRTTLSDLAGSVEAQEVLKRLNLGSLIPETGVSYLGRNRNYAGRTTTGHEVFVKQIRGDVERFERVVRFERVLERSTASLLRAPELFGYDRAAGLLVFERVVGHRTGADLAAEDVFDESLCERLGGALGDLHAMPQSDLDSSEEFRSVLPVPERLREMSLDTFVESSAAELEAWSLIQYDRNLQAGVDRLRAREQDARPCFIHGDIRLDQYLIDGTSIYLADWEEFRRGDPARDVGGFVGEWLFRAVLNITDVRGMDSAQTVSHEVILRRGVEQIRLVRPLVHAFWRGYRQARGEVDAEFGERAVAYAGWHTFERLLASASLAPRLSASHRAAVGVGRTALTAPDRFAGLLGLESRR